jgi:hypothetical protein
VRIAHLSGYTNPYPGILAPLANTNGLMFPYSPSIQQSHEADYAAMAMVHSNQDYYAYSKTPNVTLNIAAKFTVQNQTEGLYALACLHFLRSISKMNFGQNDANKGLPPPVVMFSGYGEYMYNQVRCIVKGSSVSIDDTVDKVKVTATSGSAWLPALFTVNVSIIVQQTANQMRTTFTLDTYRDGTLLAQGGWL